MKAVGPWLLLQVDKPVEISKGGIYLPVGNLEERVGYATATVLSVGRGKWDDKKKKYIPSSLVAGDRVIFRGYLQVVHKPMQLEDGQCLLHQDDVPLALEVE